MRRVAGFVGEHRVGHTAQSEAVAVAAASVEDAPAIGCELITARPDRPRIPPDRQSRRRPASSRPLPNAISCTASCSGSQPIGVGEYAVTTASTSRSPTKNAPVPTRG